MVAGELYAPQDPELVRLRAEARRILRLYNASAEGSERNALLEELLGYRPEGLWIEPPFYCDYGRNIELGRNVYLNFDCVVLDVAPVTIGDHVMLGPAVQIYTATHPMDPAERKSGRELAKPVRIGSDVWVGGGAVINPGVTIGEGAVIGSGSVVTRDVPGRVVAAGNPCRVIRPL
jgi:maltose O-acetyltransferase